MSVQLGDVLAALEGALNSSIALTAFIKDDEDPVAAGLIGVIAGIKTAMTLTEQCIDPRTTDEPEECRHPADQVVVRRAGKDTVRLCQACNEFIG